MGTKEQSSGEVPAPVPTSKDASDSNVNANSSDGIQLQHVQLPIASAAPQVIIVPVTQTATAATNAAKKIRRAFSMPRNPFRWSRKFKTSTTTADNASSAGGSNSAISSCVGGGRGRAGSIVSLSSYEAISKDTNGGNNCGASTSDESKTGDSIKRDAIGRVGEQKIVNGKPVSGGKESSSSAASNSNRILRRSSFRKFLNRIAQHVSTSINVGANKNATVSTSATADRVPPIGNYQWPADQTPGVMGLKNHGNTCFMNAVLQCLSHTDILAEYFVLDQYKADLKRRNKINSRKFGTKGELTEQLANVLKALWTCKNESDHSTSFKAVVDRYGSQFRSSTQHDAQEFLFWLLDKVHEDLNTATKRRYKSVKNSYGRPDEIIAAETLANHIRCNNSFVQAVFQAQFRSSLTCPRCEKQSNTFDPFHCISVQLPQLMQQTIFVTVVYLQRKPRQVKIGISVPIGSPIVALRDQLQTDTGIPGKRMVLVDINKEGFTRVFYDSQPVATLCGIETIYCIEVPELKNTPTTQSTTAASEKSETTHANNTNSKNSAESNSTTNTLEASKKEASGNTAIANSSTNATVAKVTNAPSTASTDTELLLLVASVRKHKSEVVCDDETAKDNGPAYTVERFGMPFSLLTTRDISYIDLQKRLLREMAPLLKPEVFSCTKPLSDMFQMRLQDPSADPDTYVQNVEHPLLTEMIDLALSVLSAEAGPPHIKLLLEWAEPEEYFADLSDKVVVDESVARLLDDSKLKKSNDTAVLTLEQCLEHYTKAETLSAEDAWRCPHCQQYLPVVKTLGLWSLPDILVVHFKRFRQHHEKGANAAKLTTMVKFPLNAFDMSPHLVRGIEEEPPRTTLSASAALDMGTFSRPSPWKKTRSGDSRSSTLSSRDNKETRYDLYAVCYHQGDTLETGHYTAACKNPYDRQWYKFDDQRVSKVVSESIEDEIINNEAYMLFYQRRAGDAAECSGSSSNSGDHWVSRIAPPSIPVVEKVIVAKEELVEEDMSEERKEDVAVAKTTAIKTTPGNPQENSADIPKLKEDMQEKNIVEEVKVETTPTVVSNEKISMDIATLDYADAEAVAVDIEVNTVGQAEIVSSTPKSLTEELVNHGVGDNQIFVMDEDCHLDESPSPSPSTPAIDNVASAAKLHQSPISTTKRVTVATTTLPIVAAPSTTPSKSPVAIPTNTVLTNGNATDNSILPNRSSSTFIIGKPKSPAMAIIPMPVIPAAGINGNRIRNSSTSSSSSSLSSHSSPHSLAASIHGASTLQHKFNGFSNTSATASNNYKEVLLSSSLKSNSSSIISAAVAAHTAHEFHLTRHQPWNGSRSSVSALESSTQASNHQHVHGLNLRHSFSTSSNCKLRECSETLSSMLRNSTNTCSKDTLIFIDQQNHHHHHSLIEDDDDSFMGSRSLWISPVTPHKLITVSPKN